MKIFKFYEDREVIIRSKYYLHDKGTQIHTTHMHAVSNLELSKANHCVNNNYNNFSTELMWVFIQVYSRAN